MIANTLTARSNSTDATTWMLRRADPVAGNFELVGDKITIGSGQSCTLRLIDAGVRALHCLVVRSDCGLNVRRWSDDTLLNGEVFTEATLEPGDRLTIGPVELIVECELAEQPVEECYFDPSIVESVVEAAIQEQEILTASSARNEQIHERATSARRRAKQLVELVRQERSECQRLAMDIASLESRLASTESEREELVFERDELAARLATLTVEISLVRDEVRALSASHQEREQALESRLVELEHQIADRDSQVIDLRDELDRQRNEAQERLRYELEQAEAAEVSTGEFRGEETSNWVPGRDTEYSPSIPLPSELSIDDYLPVEVGSRELDHASMIENSTPESESHTEIETERAADESLWDIELQPSGTGTSETVEIAETILPPLAETFLPESEQHNLATPVRSEEDLWGRLSSLRAEASERLHYKVEHPEEGTEASHDFWVSPQVKEESQGVPELHPEESSHWLAETIAEPDAMEVVAEAETSAPVKREEPVSFIEKYKHLLDDEGTASVPVRREPEPVAKPAPKDAHGDDESIEDYMEKMMARLRGEPTGPTLMGDSKQREAQAVKQEVTPAKPVLITSATPVEPLENLDAMKSGPTPEHATDMSMLRDLANSSAREAIKISYSRRQRERAHSNLLMCLIGGVAGGYLVWASKGEMNLQLATGAVAIAAAGYWAFRCMGALFAPRQPKA